MTIQLPSNFRSEFFVFKLFSRNARVGLQLPIALSTMVLRIGFTKKYSRSASMFMEIIVAFKNSSPTRRGRRRNRVNPPLLAAETAAQGFLLSVSSRWDPPRAAVGGALSHRMQAVLQRAIQK